MTLVDVLHDPISEITETGLRTALQHYDLDVLIFATGFEAFRGALESAGIRNRYGDGIGDAWARGPHTLLGLMTPGFPNMFHPTNAGSPSVLGNSMLMHELLADWISDCIKHMAASGYTSVQPARSATEEWGTVVAHHAAKLLRRNENQYMVHVDADGSRVFIPFTGGMSEYTPRLRESAERGYEGFVFDGADGCATPLRNAARSRIAFRGTLLDLHYHVSRPRTSLSTRRRIINHRELGLSQ